MSQAVPTGPREEWAHGQLWRWILQTTLSEDYSGMFPCPKCKSDKTTYYQLQTRSADEPATNYLCFKRGKEVSATTPPVYIRYVLRRREETQRRDTLGRVISRDKDRTGWIFLSPSSDGVCTVSMMMRPLSRTRTSWRRLETSVNQPWMYRMLAMGVTADTPIMPSCAVECESEDESLVDEFED